MNPDTNTPGDRDSRAADATRTWFENFMRSLPAAAHSDFAAFTASLASASGPRADELRQLEEGFYREHLALWSALADPRTPTPAPPPDDPRFRSPHWRELPFFGYLRQAYLLNCRYVMELAQRADMAAAPRRRLEFVLRQLLDAASPANFAFTNPEVIDLAFRTDGESLARGMKNMASDVARGRITMSDESAFEVGRDLAVTPGAVVLENEVMQLIHYAPATAQVFERPLLIVPPFINKYYILDLRPENSFARYCIGQGFNTYMISWRNVPPEAGTLSWDDYVVKGVLAAIKAARAISGAEQVNALGFCVGGTLLATALASADGPTRAGVASLTLLATLLDFSDTGAISVYVDPDFVAQAEQEFASGGIMPGSRLAATFATLRANDLIWPMVIEGYLKGRALRPFDLLFWNADSANLPGSLYVFYLRNMYLENNLTTPGKVVVNGTTLNLQALDLPAYVMAAREDHIVPWTSAYRSMALLGGNSVFTLSTSGHVAGIVNPAGTSHRHYWARGNLSADPDGWLESAERHSGSWWPDWIKWLTPRAGKLIPAAGQLGSLDFPVLEPAPGRYVRE